MSAKRIHSPPTSSQTSPVHKSARATATTATPPLLCTLPPTCNKGKGTPLDGTRDLEAHYAKYHAHVCSVPGCECVFPDARLLELHLTECHDPLAEVRKERGEKIFACHLATCPQYFRSPKTRRLHLIQAHGYPKEYFFAVTNKGVGGLLRKWGEGASLVRGTWKAREQLNGDGEDTDDGADADADGMDEDAQENNHAKRSTPTPTQTSTSLRQTRSDDVDALASGMSSLSLVPSSIRFGRGAKSAGHLGRHAHGSSHSQPADPPSPAQPVPPPSQATTTDATDVDADESEEEEDRSANHVVLPARGRGRGRGLGRGGRGRGRVLIPPRGGPGMHRGMYVPRSGRGRGA